MTCLQKFFVAIFSTMLPLDFLDQLGSNVAVNTTGIAGTVAVQQIGGGVVRSADSVTSPAADDDDDNNATAPLANGQAGADGQNDDIRVGTSADTDDDSADELLSESEQEASISKSQFILEFFWLGMLTRKFWLGM